MVRIDYPFSLSINGSLWLISINLQKEQVILYNRSSNITLVAPISFFLRHYDPKLDSSQRITPGRIRDYIKENYDKSR